MDPILLDSRYELTAMVFPEPGGPASHTMERFSPLSSRVNSLLLRRMPEKPGRVILAISAWQCCFM